jgi:glutamine---fructose-6-phosphate transaminase (isomerizing)
MCGIVGYIGDKDITTVLLVGLERLSYRGYDSSGIAVLSEGELSSWKKSGKIKQLDNLISGLSINAPIGIGHTRWATHGIPNDVNSHPHFCSRKKIAVVHNGIIENYQEIKSQLINDGVLFHTETDTEVIAHLIEKFYKHSLLQAVTKATTILKGSYALAIISEYESDKIITARMGSPLAIGIGKNEQFISSDINTMLPHTKEILFLEDHQFAVVEKTNVTVFDEKGNEIEKNIKQINWNPEKSEKDGYDSFMLKEIHEQPAIIRKIISKYVTNENSIEFKGLAKVDLENVTRFIIQACGTSWHAGLYGKYILENFSKVLTEVDISSEFRYRRMISQTNNIVLAISQSGETADTLAGLRQAKANYLPVISFVNVKNSSIDRESDGVVYSYSGQEVGVASTKNYLSQLTTFYLFSINLALIKNEISPKMAFTQLQDLKCIPDYIEKILEQKNHIKAIADKYCLSDQFLFIGRGVNYPSALEGALKLKEISYIHATGYAAGELKHGPIALIDSKLPIVCIATNSPTYSKMISNIEEVKSRKGKIIIIATEGNSEVSKFSEDIIYIPKTSEELSPLLTAIPMQLLAYYIATTLNFDVDQPRNLAKSVTVE